MGTKPVGDAARDTMESPLPSIAVVDLLPIRRSGTVAALISQGFSDVVSADLVDNITNSRSFEVVVLVCGKQDLEYSVATKLLEIREKYSEAKVCILLDGDVEDFAEELAASPFPCDALLDGMAEARTLRSAIQLIDRGFKVFPHTLTSPAPVAHATLHQPLDRSSLQVVQESDLLQRSTKRQRQVIELLVMGLSNKEIGQRLAISDSTVKAHVRSIMDLFEVRSRTQIVSRLAMALPSHEKGDPALPQDTSAIPAISTDE